MPQVDLFGNSLTQCAFCSIVAERAAAFVVYQDENVVAFLDYQPLFPGHVLVVPREHHETLADLPAEKINDLFQVVRHLSLAVERAMSAGGTFVAMNNRVSQSVPHLHVHVVPRNRKDGLRGFFWPRNKYDSPRQIVVVQGAIDAEMRKLIG